MGAGTVERVTAVDSLFGDGSGDGSPTSTNASSFGNEYHDDGSGTGYGLDTYDFGFGDGGFGHGEGFGSGEGEYGFGLDDYGLADGSGFGHGLDDDLLVWYLLFFQPPAPDSAAAETETGG